MKLPCLISDMSTAEYLADPCETPSLSASVAHTLISKSPAHVYLEHPKLGGQKREATREMDKGSLIHAILLGIGSEFKVLDFENYRTKEAQVIRDQTRAAGFIPVLAQQVVEAETVCNAIREKLSVFGYILPAINSEQTIIWEEGTSAGNKVLCRARLDSYAGPWDILDIKTMQSCHPDAIGPHLIRYGADIQLAAYTSAVETLCPDDVGKTQFTFLCCETEPPYAVTAAIPSGTMMALGKWKWRQAVETWAKCLSENRWPGYADAPIIIDVPTWSLQKMVESEPNFLEEEYGKNNTTI